jgi:hypothetical protein
MNLVPLALPDYCVLQSLPHEKWNFNVNGFRTFKRALNCASQFLITCQYQLFEVSSSKKYTCLGGSIILSRTCQTSIKFQFFWDLNQIRSVDQYQVLVTTSNLISGPLQSTGVLLVLTKAVSLVTTQLEVTPAHAFSAIGPWLWTIGIICSGGQKRVTATPNYLSVIADVLVHCPFK